MACLQGDKLLGEAKQLRTAREVVFMVPPDLTPGEYTLQVRVRLGQDEHLVVGVLRQKLTVPAP